MADQTTMNGGRGRTGFRGQNGQKNVGDLGRDVAALVELQLKLLEEDLRDAGHRAAVPAALLAGALVLALGCVPVLLIALARAIELSGVPPWASLLIAGLLALVASGLAGLAGWLRARSCLKILNRSYQEFLQNLRWVKSAFVSKAIGDRPPSGSP